MDALDLNRWQRLAPMALLFLIIGGSVRFVRQNFYVFAGAGFSFAFIGRLGLREFLLAGLLALLIAVLTAVVYHRRFQFRTEADALRVRSGLFVKKDLRMRFARVQNISISQPFYFRPFGLVRFTAETPGAESTELELPGIRRALALSLRDRVAQYGGAAEVSDKTLDEQGAPEPLEAEIDSVDSADSGLIHAPSAARVFIHGLVSNQVWLLAGLAAWLAGTMWERAESWIEASGISRLLQLVLSLGWAGGVVVVAVSGALLFVLSGLLSLLRFHDFELRDHGDRFRAVCGLHDRREQTIRREKLTGLTLIQTALGRLFGQWYLIGRQTTAAEADFSGRNQRFMVPGVRAGDLALVAELMPGFAVPQDMQTISRRFRTVYWTRLAVPVLAVCALTWWLWPGARLALAGLLIVLLVVLWLIHQSWRRWAWRLDSGRCWVQQGLFGRRLDAFELRLVQQAVLVRTPYLRRHGLASVRLVLPHGRIVVPFLRVEDAVELINRAAYAAETSPVHRV